MFSSVDTKNPAAVCAHVASAYQGLFPAGDETFVPQAVNWIVSCFHGQVAGYQALDAHYHDLEHTLQGTLCMVELLQSRHNAGVLPRLVQRDFELGLIAILFHDTGYLKEQGDNEGTGAKYTSTHVNRSSDFAAHFLSKKGFSSSEILSVQNMIHCTGVNTVLSAIPFQSEAERIVGFALATADLLGQMAAPDYVEKLPMLYEEFAEASHFDHDSGSFVARFTSPEDLVAKTPGFWKNFVKPKLEKDFLGLFRFLDRPYPNGRNVYLEKIEENISRLQRQLEACPRKG